jgi:hypothetical protein
MKNKTNAKDGNFKFKLQVKIDGLPPTQNRLNTMHYMAKARIAKQWREAVMWAVGSCIPSKPIEKAKITITRHSSVEGDGDNYSGGYKNIIDSLRALKILKEDRVSNIGNIQTPWIKARPGKGHIEIQVEEL